MATSVTQAHTAAAPRLGPPTTVSPHVRLNTLTDRVNESPTDRSSSTSTGTTKNVASAQEAPAIRATILPTNPKRPSITRSTMPTVAATTAQRTIGPARRLAAASA